LGAGAIGLVTVVAAGLGAKADSLGAGAVGLVADGADGWNAGILWMGVGLNISL
jgi:hypothetical protein